MRKMILAAALATSASLAAAETGVRPGLWEVKLVRQFMDGRDVTVFVPVALAGMTQMMDNLTPQQRKQMEAAFGRPPTNTTQRLCVSPEMAAGDKPLLPPEVKCEPTAFSREGTKMTFAFDCADQGRTASGRGESQLGAERVSTRIDMVTTDSTGRHTWQNESLATYVGADCGSLKPADKVVREQQRQ